MNQMTKLLDKIERRLGARPLNLPADIAKNAWAEKVIANETLDTFSRFYPHRIVYLLGPHNKKNGYYLVDEDICESQEILGAGDINWHEFSAKSPGYVGSGMNSFAMMDASYDFEDIAMTQMAADHASLFSSGIYVEWQEPNRIKLSGVLSNSYINFQKNIPINLFIKHPLNLMTIPKTKMETFEALAQADIAIFLVEYLKHYDGIDTVFATTDLKLSALEEKANKRDDVVQKLEDSYVSAGNLNQPVMFTIN